MIQLKQQLENNSNENKNEILDRILTLMDKNNKKYDEHTELLKKLNDKYNNISKCIQSSHDLRCLNYYTDENRLEINCNYKK